LDAHSVDWLEAFLKEFKGSVVTVTHDRALMESLAEWVVDVEYGKLAIYEGNYSTYLDKKSRQLDGERVKGAALQKQLSRELEFVR
jgi:ATPase subunit of ABC transporter with duplicated ATPase domains